MRTKTALLTATLLALLIAGCRGGSSPTEGIAGTYRFSFSTSLSNTSGAPTIQNAQVRLDNAVKMDSCPPGDTENDYDENGNLVAVVCIAPGTATVALHSADKIGAGNHTLLFFMAQQIGNFSPSPYRVMAFSMQITDANGKVVKTITLPAESGSLIDGQAIAYTFSI
jgi:hypothetical protein